MWTCFWDMHSGGGAKEKWEIIYIEAPQDEAEVIFYNRFGHSPRRVTCTCCGRDYSIDESNKGLDQVTGYHRNCTSINIGKYKWKYIEEPNREYNEEAEVIPLEDYIKSPKVLVIFKEGIKPEEREGDVPDQGYMWMG